MSTKNLSSLVLNDVWTIPINWEWVSISQISSIISGGTPSTKIEQYYNGDISWITPADMSNHRDVYISKGRRNITQEGLDNSSAQILPRGTVLFSSRAPIGYVAIAANDVTTNQGFKSFIPENGISSKYLYYWLVFAKPFAEKLASGTTFLEISGRNSALLPFPLAPEYEQKRIVEKLDETFSELDAGVKELELAQKKLTQYRHSLLKSAVEGGLTQKWRNENKEKIDETGEELLERILIERRQRWEQQKLEEFKAKDKTPPKNWQDKYPEPVKPDTSNLPELPQGWTWASLSQLVEIIQIGPFGSLLHKSDYIAGGIPLINPTHIKNLMIEPDNNLTITEEKRTALNKYAMSEGDIIIGRRGEMGRCALVTDNENGWLCGTGSLFIRLLKSLNPEFYTWVLSSKRTKDYLAEVSVGTTMQNLNQKILHSIPVPLLSRAEQTAASEILHNEYERIDRQIQDIEIALKQSNAQRKNILKSAFSGQLVSQNASDEPASVLLEKIKKEREELAKQAKPKKIRQPKKKVNVMDTLLEVLTVEDRWIDAQEAFKKCGIVDGTSTDRVEEIYTELRKLEKSGQIEVERNGSYDQIRLIKQAVKED